MAHACGWGRAGSPLWGGVLEGGGEPCLWVYDMVKNATTTAGHPGSGVMIDGHICKLWAAA